MSNGEYAHILSTGGCIYFLENSGHLISRNLREFFSTGLVDTMVTNIRNVHQVFTGHKNACMSIYLILIQIGYLATDEIVIVSNRV